MSELDLQRDQDLVTLITCTPYGINTHRMLVRAHRVESATTKVAVPAEASLIPNYVIVPMVALPMLFVYLIGALGYYRLTDQGGTREDAISKLDELKRRRKAARKQ